jgi:hypothetical protein
MTNYYETISYAALAGIFIVLGIVSWFILRALELKGFFNKGGGLK